MSRVKGCSNPNPLTLSPIPTIHSVDNALFPPPQMPDGGAEPFHSSVEVVLHGHTELLSYFVVQCNFAFDYILEI